jgi:DNA-binding CsgD family transcriptional regulator
VLTRSQRQPWPVTIPDVVAQDGLVLERDRELDRIRWRLRLAREGRGGALVVEGPAGIGKTVVLGAARELAEGGGFRVLRARGAELEREFAFGVVRQLVEPLLAEASDEELASLLEGPPGVAAGLLGLTRGRDLIGQSAPVAPDPSFAVLHGLYWLFANLAARRPVALVMDDAQWADRASLRFLAFLLPRLEELRAVLMMAARAAEAGAREGELFAVLTMDPATEILTLAPLSAGGVARLIAAGLGSEPEAAFASACRDATGGTPFLVRTLVAALVEEGVPPVDASASRVRGLATATVGRWAVLQLRRLGPDATRLARAVSILERAEPAVAAGLAGLAPGAAAEAAELLVRAGVLEERPLAFAHPILRAGVYGEIAATDRAEAHGRAARLLAERQAGEARVAEHLLMTAPAGDGWVVEQLRDAARAAAARGAPDSAVAYLRRALAEPPAAEVGAGLLLDLGSAEYSAGYPSWEEHLTAAVAAAGDDTARAAAGLQLATALGLHHRLAEAVEVVDHVQADLPGHDCESRVTLEAMAVALGLLDAGMGPSVADRASALVVLAKKRSVPRHALAVAAYVAALANEPAEQAAELARRAIAAGPRALPDPGEPPWFLHATIALFWAERYDEAQALLDATVAEARATANGLVLPAVLAHRAWLALRRGDLIAVEADARALGEAPDLSATLLHRPIAMGALVEALVERGELDAAEGTLEPLAADLRSMSQTTALLRHARSRLRRAQGRFPEALADLRAVGEIATRTQARSPCYLPWRSDTALVQLTLGDGDAARLLCEEEVELARAFGARRALGVALRASGLAAGGAHGESRLREAIEVLCGPDTRLEQARALADLGALLRRSDRPADARELLRRAVDAAHRAGARPLADRAETELRATGARPRRVLLTGLESLTASERRIAELAAQGLTNHQIAQNLFVTARTVEGHLTNVFTKLDVRARIELSAALGATATRGAQA